MQIKWTIGSYTKLLSGELQSTQRHMVKGQSYVHTIRVLDFSKTNQKIYFTVTSNDLAISESISIYTKNSTNPLVNQPSRQKKLTPKLKVTRDENGFLRLEEEPDDIIY